MPGDRRARIGSGMPNTISEMETQNNDVMNVFLFNRVVVFNRLFYKSVCGEPEVAMSDTATLFLFCSRRPPID